MISIIIPTIGRIDTIKRAIKSAVLIDEKFISQIIIINNSQSYEFELFLKHYCEKLEDSRIEIMLLQKRYSMAESWNSATNNLKENWVIYLHDDDELLNFNSQIEKIKNIILDNKNAGFIAFEYICSYKSKIFGLEKKVKRGFSGKNSALRIIRNCPKLVSTIINVESLKRAGGWRDYYGYFLDLMLFLEISHNSPALFIEFPLGVYYLHEENESSVEKRAIHYGDYIPKVCAHIFNLYKDKNIRSEFIHMLGKFVYPQNFK
jgi:glycosyltransferase involved in cell wall biosynthesis